MKHTSTDIKETNECIAPVTSAYDPVVVQTMQKIARDHKEVLTHLSQFGSIIEKAKARLIFEIAATGGV